MGRKTVFLLGNKKLNMSKKILFFIGLWFIHFGIAEKLKEKTGHKLFAITDLPEKMTNFIKTQKLVKFEKTWDYLENTIQNEHKPDILYLQGIEQKYNLNLLNIVYTQKDFYPEYNPFHKFTEKEILTLLENECRFYEKVIEEVNPDYLCLLSTVTHQETLFYKMCKAKGIKILMLIPLKFKHRAMISEYEHGPSPTLYSKSDEDEFKFTDEEIRNFWTSQDLHSHVYEWQEKNFESHFFERYKGALRFFINPKTKTFKNRYTNFGKSNSKVFADKISRSKQRKQLNKFTDEKFIRSVEDKHFVYYPLNYEPERVTLTAGHFYTDQLSLIKNIAKSLPPGYKLYVKEHPAMKTLGWRNISYYKQIMDLPNARMLHTDLKHDEIIQKCSLVITIAGTGGIEAAFYEKPAIFIGDIGLPNIPAFHLLKNLEDLPETIRACLRKKIKISDLNNFVSIMKKYSFQFDLDGLGTDLSYRFGFKGLHIDAELSDQKVKEFLFDNEKIFEKLANEHIKKIKLLLDT